MLSFPFRRNRENSISSWQSQRRYRYGPPMERTVSHPGRVKEDIGMVPKWREQYLILAESKISVWSPNGVMGRENNDGRGGGGGGGKKVVGNNKQK